MKPQDLPIEQLSTPFLGLRGDLFDPLLRAGLGGEASQTRPRSGSDATRAAKPGAVEAHVARSEAELAEADSLVYQRYAWRGYRFPIIEASLRDYTGLSGPYLTILCRVGGSVAGTLTLGLDSKAGLFADELFRANIDRLRRGGRRVCEMGRLAVRAGSNYRNVLAAMFQLVHDLACILHGITDVVIEVNPRHAGFYQRTLGFQPVGEEKVCPRVGAPSQLLSLSVEGFARVLDAAYNSGDDRCMAVHGSHVPAHG